MNTHLNRIIIELENENDQSTTYEPNENTTSDHLNRRFSFDYSATYIALLFLCWLNVYFLIKIYIYTNSCNNIYRVTVCS
jgi:hypothetical protein